MNSSVAALTLFLVAASLLQAQARPTGLGSCCLTLRPKPALLKNLKSYEIRTDCPLQAIVFYPKRGMPICADPNQQWTKDLMRCLPENGQQAPPNVKC